MITKNRLDNLVKKYEIKSFTDTDPSQFLRLFKDEKDDNFDEEYEEDLEEEYDDIEEEYRELFCNDEITVDRELTEVNYGSVSVTLYYETDPYTITFSAWLSRKQRRSSASSIPPSKS